MLKRFLALLAVTAWVHAGFAAPSARAAQGDTLRTETLQVVIATEPETSITIRTLGADGWLPAASMTGDALSAIDAFSPEHPVPNTGADWRVTRRGEHAVVMSADLNGRLLERDISIDTSRNAVHVATSISLLGDEVLASLFDHWSFPAREPDFAWVPNLRPGPDLIIGEHTFRSPAVILGHEGMWAAVMPDLDSLPGLPRFRLAALDLNRLDRELPEFGYGLKAHDPVFHVYYRHDPARVFTYPPGTITYAYDVLAAAGAPRVRFLEAVNDHLWDRYGTRLLGDVRPQVLPFEDYARVSYRTLDSLKQFVHFELDGRPAGAYRAEDHGTYFILPKPMVWNQAWFNAQRTAYGQAFYGLHHVAEGLSEMARLTSAFTLNAPRYEGLFPAVYAYERDEWIASPPRLNGGENRFHAASAAWTALWLWRLHRDLLPDERAEEPVFALADFLVRRQHPNGSIPAWFDRDPDTGAVEAHPTLEMSAETGGSALLLGELAIDSGRRDYAEATLRAAEFLIAEVLPGMKYFDFETFWSCSWKSTDMVDPYTGVVPQNTYSMYWAAETFRMAYLLSGEQRYMDGLMETMHLLNLYQQVWNPPFLSLYAFGGFGVMNTDGEWNDSRQAVFAPLYMAVYDLTGDPVWMHRGIAALRASFALFAIPENCEISPYTCAAYPPGISPESLGHSGVNGTSGRSDSGWGEGGALAASAYVTQHYGHLYMDTGRGKAFGIDAVLVRTADVSGGMLHVAFEEAAGRSREITIRTDDGREIKTFVEPGRRHQIAIPVNP